VIGFVVAVIVLLVVTVAVPPKWWRVAAIVLHAGPFLYEGRRTNKRIEGLHPDQQQAIKDAWCDKWRDEPLRICLKFRGVFIKVGQVVSNLEGLIPKEFTIPLQVLREHCPCEQWSVVKDTIEHHTGLGINELFKSISEEPVASASIGQVHFATLHDNTPVVVKVQYPDVERNFNADYTFCTRALHGFSSDQAMLDVIESVGKNYNEEFDFQKEAINLRIMHDAVQGLYPGIRIPEPFDCTNRKTRGRSLVTRKVLIMERAYGKSLTTISEEMFRKWAASNGKTPEEMMAELQDPEFWSKPQKVLPLLSQSAMNLIQETALPLTGPLRNALAYLYNAGAEAIGAETMDIDKIPTTTPLVGTRVAHMICDVQGYMLFELGAINNDPHPGNILYDEETGVCTLLDYGGLVFLTEKERIGYARVFIAIENRDKEEIFRFAAGNGIRFSQDDVHEKVESIHKDYIYANALITLGGFAGLRDGVAILATLEPRAYQLRGVDVAAHAPEATYEHHIYQMLLKSIICLATSCGCLGLIGPSPSGLLKTRAEHFLDSRGIARTSAGEVSSLP